MKNFSSKTLHMKLKWLSPPPHLTLLCWVSIAAGRMSGFTAGWERRRCFGACKGGEGGVSCQRSSSSPWAATLMELLVSGSRFGWCNMGFKKRTIQSYIFKILSTDFSLNSGFRVWEGHQNQRRFMQRWRRRKLKPKLSTMEFDQLTCKRPNPVRLYYRL